MSLVLRFRSEVDLPNHAAIHSLGINMSELYNLNVNIRICIIRDLKIISYHYNCKRTFRWLERGKGRKRQVNF